MRRVVRSLAVVVTVLGIVTSAFGVVSARRADLAAANAFGPGDGTPDSQAFIGTGDSPSI